MINNFNTEYYGQLLALYQQKTITSEEENEREHPNFEQIFYPTPA